MTHEELLKEMYEVCAFLESKRKELEAKYKNPSFSNGVDSWTFRILKSFCEDDPLAYEFDRISGYLESVSEFDYHTGDGVRKAMETGQLNF